MIRILIAMCIIDNLLVLPASDFPYFSRMISERRISCCRGIFMNVEGLLLGKITIMLEELKTLDFNQLKIEIRPA